MKILIYGLTDISYLIAKDLCTDHDIIIIDDADELPPRFEKIDMSFVQGSISDPSTLKAAGAAGCNLFISCSKSDEANIVATWAVTRIARMETVCFVSKMEYFRSITNDEFYSSEVGIDHVLWGEESVVKEIFRIVSVPEVIYVDYFEGGKARLFEYKIREGFSLAGRELRSCQFPDETMMLALTRDGELFIPNGSTKMQVGDQPIFIGSPNGLSMLARSFFSTKEERIDNAVIIGGGNIGFMLAKRLESVGVKTKIIEKDMERCEFLAEKLSKTLVINASASDLDTLEEEDIGEADAVINVTNSDETNLFCSIMAKQMGAGKVFARAGSDSMIPIFEKSGIDVALSPERTIVNELRNKIINKDSGLLAVVGKGQGKLFELELPAPFNGKKVMDLRIPCRALIGVLEHKRKIIIPKGQTVLHEGDRLILFSKAEDSESVARYFRRANED